MRWHSGLKTAVTVTLECALAGDTCILVACSRGSEEVGRIHVAPAEVAGSISRGRNDWNSKRMGLTSKISFRIFSRFITQAGGAY